MIKTFTIKNFRCFQDLKIEHLERINLIVGKNNVGKTALLEALWLHYGYFNPGLALSINAFRGLEKYKSNELLWDLFHGFTPVKAAILSSQNNNGKHHTLSIELVEKLKSTRYLNKPQEQEIKSTSANPVNPEISRMGDSELQLSYYEEKKLLATSKIYIDDDKLKIEKASNRDRVESVFRPSSRKERNEEKAERLSKVLKNRQQADKIIKALKIVEDRIEDLSILYIAGDPIIHAALKGENQLIPLPFMGDGISSLLSMALSITHASGGAVLIDEIENGLHHSVMGEIGTAIAELATECNVQIFATSHSEECVIAMRNGIATAPNSDKSGRLFRLERKNEQIIAVSYTLDELEIAEKHGIEVR